MKDGLLSRMGVAKVVHEVEDEYEVETYAGLDEMQLQLLTPTRIWRFLSRSFRTRNGPTGL
jgi:hypothetical protein